MGLELKDIVKIYDNGFQAVTDFNLSIKDKEFIIFVGPSGCGKSTTLRMIAGLETITKGIFTIDGKVVNDLSPKDRGIAMVFQSYALYPNLTVYENMAFGLELAGFDEDVIAQRVKEAAEVLNLTAYLDRKPRALSGGQRQRVALGRAIIRHAKIFLMDEPLSNLDAKLRVEMRSELIKIHRQVGATTIYVTHDQIEAMTMADRIVVMNLGRIQQVGTPKELYFHPQNLFVAGFIGDPPMNFVNGHLEGKNFVADDGALTLDISNQGDSYLKLLEGKRLVFAYRPEHVKYECGTPKGDFYKLNGKVEVSEMLGDIQNVYVNIGSAKSVLKATPTQSFTIDSDVEYYVEKHDVRFFDADTENVITNEELEYGKAAPKAKTSKKAKADEAEDIAK
jgi:multiple sugar transport system ATP-binding protein